MHGQCEENVFSCEGWKTVRRQGGLPSLQVYKSYLSLPHFFFLAKEVYFLAQSLLHSKQSEKLKQGGINLVHKASQLPCLVDGTPDVCQT